MEKLKKLGASFWVMFGIVVANAIGFIVAVCFLPSSVPTHIDGTMTIDGVGSPWILLILPLIALLVVLAFGAYLIFRKENKNTRVLMITLFVICVLFIWLSWVFFAVALSGQALGEKVSLSMSLLVMLPIGLLFIIMGNYMPKVRQNRALGIKLPWTLKNAECWKKTHIFGGYAMVIAGALISIGAIICGLCGIDVYVFIFFGEGLVGMILATTIYSKVTFDRLQAGNAENLENNN